MSPISVWICRASRAVAETGVEVVLAQRGGTGDLPPVLDHRQLMWRGQFLQAGKSGRWRRPRPVEGVTQRRQSAVVDSGQPERIGTFLVRLLAASRGHGTGGLLGTRAGRTAGSGGSAGRSARARLRWWSRARCGCPCRRGVAGCGAAEQRGQFRRSSAPFSPYIRARPARASASMSSSSSTGERRPRARRAPRSAETRRQEDVAVVGEAGSVQRGMTSPWRKSSWSRTRSYSTEASKVRRGRREPRRRSGPRRG